MHLYDTELAAFKTQFASSTIDTAFNILLSAEVVVVKCAGKSFYESLHSTWLLVMKDHIKMLLASRDNDSETAERHRLAAEVTFRSLKARVSGIVIASGPSSVVQVNSPVLMGGVMNISHDQQNTTYSVSIGDLLQAIDRSGGSDDAKAEAKTRLERFLEHPLVASVLGGLAGGVSI